MSKSRDKETGRYVSEEIRNTTTKAAEQVTLPVNDAAGDDEYVQRARQFPTDAYAAPDPMDDEMDLKARLTTEEEGGAPGRTKYGELQWDDRIPAYMKKKEDAEIKMAFERWFADNFDRMSPAQKAYAREIYPNFYRSRLRTLKKNAKLVEELARIKITGPQTRKDLMLEFAVDQGLIDVDEFANLLNPERNQEQMKAQFKRGMWNSRSWKLGRAPVTDNDRAEARSAYYGNRAPPGGIMNDFPFTDAQARRGRIGYPRDF